MRRPVAIAAGVVAFAFLTGGTAWHGRDYSTIERRSDGDTRLKVCDREPDTHNAGGAIKRKNGDGGYYYDRDGYGGSCGYSPWGASGVRGHSVGEGGPLGSESWVWH